MKRLKSDEFVTAWESAASLAEVSVCLTRLGHSDFTPRKCKWAAHFFRRMGIKLKTMPTSDLPDYAEDQEVVEAAPIASPVPAQVAFDYIYTFDDGIWVQSRV